MEWSAIASIVFVCVTMNHLGLISAAEDVFKKKLVILNCPKCSSFWLTLIYDVWCIDDYTDIPFVLAVSFLSSYAALWLGLFEGFIDTYYLMFYEKIYPDEDDTATSDA